MRIGKRLVAISIATQDRTRYQGASVICCTHCDPLLIISSGLRTNLSSVRHSSGIRDAQAPPPPKTHRVESLLPSQFRQPKPKTQEYPPIAPLGLAPSAVIRGSVKGEEEEFGQIPDYSGFFEAQKEKHRTEARDSKFTIQRKDLPSHPILASPKDEGDADDEEEVSAIPAVTLTLATPELSSPHDVQHDTSRSGCTTTGRGGLGLCIGGDVDGVDVDRRSEHTHAQENKDRH
ncbi:hypothetical protein H0H87_002166 [Tephrocybe sp. NHM501043]|nr:hypothetical protein H0H87_002166 [Tephrocybe sp. NHM501043]